MARPAGILALALVLALMGCASGPELPQAKYDVAANEYLYGLGAWSLEGRLSLAGKDSSWSANIVWRHVPGKEWIRLSGPLGQGGAVVELVGGVVSIDRGNGDVQRSDSPDSFLSQQLGISVPVDSLRYWVVGLPQPAYESRMVVDGFSQLGWLVGYRQMQNIEGRVLPRNISVVKERVRLKLFIDNWVLESAKTR